MNLPPLRVALLALTFLFGAFQSSFGQQPPPASPSQVQSAAAARSEREQKEVGDRFSRGWWDKLKEGGTTALVQVAVSIFGAMFIFERFSNLRRNKIIPRGLGRKARDLWQ